MECWKSSAEFLFKFTKVSILNFEKFLRNFKYLTTNGLLENNVLYFSRNFNENLIYKKLWNLKEISKNNFG